MVNNTKQVEDSTIDRRAFVHFAAAGAAAGLAGCGGGDGGGNEGGNDDNQQATQGTTTGPQEGGKLIWGHSETVQGLDMMTVAAASTDRLTNNIYDTLLGVGENLAPTTDRGVINPGLAESYEISEDRTSYTFTLREGVKFHDGATLTSEDVKYSFNRIKSDGLISFAFQNIDSIETPDDRTVVVNLTQVYQPFLTFVAYCKAPIIPVDSGPDQNTNPIGTGAFKFVSRQQGNKTVLEAFDDYWGEGPYIDTLEERTVTDPDTRLTGIQEGTYHFINDIPLDDMDNILNNSNDNLQTRSWDPLSWAYINMNNTEPPFDDKQFRKAIAFAIDQEEVIEGALFGHGRPTATPSYPNSFERNNELQPREQDFERAQSLLDQSSYNPEDFDITFKVTTNYPWHIDAATIIQQYFSQIGLSVEIEQLQWSDWLSQVFVNSEFRLSFLNFFHQWPPQILYKLQWYTDNAYNFRGYSSEQFDQAIDNAVAATSREEAAQSYKQAQEILHEDVPDIFMWYRDGTLVAGPDVGGLDRAVHPNKSDLNFEEVWLGN